MKPHRKALKQKDIVKLEELQSRHPANRTPDEEKEMVRLQERRNQYGEQV